MAERTCSIEGCERPHRSRGWCNVHYQRWYKTGDPLTVRPGRWAGYEKPICLIDGCGKPAHARGLCSVHAPRHRRHGDPLAGRRPNIAGPETERFWARVERPSPDDCWPWRYGRFAAGYGEFVSDAGLVYAHRWAYEHYIGPIPVGLVVDHRCHNEDQECPGGRTCEHKRCVNPRHLEAVTLERNVRRARLRSNDW